MNHYDEHSRASNRADESSSQTRHRPHDEENTYRSGGEFSRPRSASGARGSDFSGTDEYLGRRESLERGSYSPRNEQDYGNQMSPGALGSRNSPYSSSYNDFSEAGYGGYGSVGHERFSADEGRYQAGGYQEGGRQESGRWGSAQRDWPNNEFNRSGNARGQWSSERIYGSQGGAQGQQAQEYGGYGNPQRQSRAQQNFGVNRGETGGSNYASPYGSHESEDFEPDYRYWRQEQMRALDDDYRAWRQNNRKRFSDEFTEWRNSRRGGQGQGMQNQSAQQHHQSSDKDEHKSSSTLGSSNSGSSKSKAS